MKKLNKDLAAMGKMTSLGLVAVGVVLVILDLVLHRHGEIEAESIPLFPALFGFVVFVLIVLLGMVLRKLVMRREDYYDSD